MIIKRKMPKIHTIATDATINSTDKLLGSDSAAGSVNTTKNYTVSALKTFVLDDSSLIKTTGDQTLAGVKTFSSSIVGNLTGNVTGNVTGNLTGNVTGNLTGDVTGDITGDVTGDLTGDVTGNLTGAVTGNLTGNVNGNVTGDVTGDVTGNVTGAVTGNVTGNLTGNVTGNVTGNLTGNPTVTELAFSTTLGKIKEASVTVSSVDLLALNAGGNYTLIAAAGSNRAIIPMSITIKSDPGATAFNFNESLYIGHQNEVSSTSTDYFAAVGAGFVNNATVLFRHFPTTKAANEHVDIRVNDPLVLHATGTATVTAGNGDLKVKIIYREVDFT